MNARRVALVTGAAGGIGAAICRRLLRDEYAVAMVDCNRLGLESLSSDMDAADETIMLLVGDLAELSFVEGLPSRVVDKFGRLDVLVNNAAWRSTATMREIDLAAWERTVRVCLTTPAFLARESARYMERSGGGVIINIGSIMARQAAGYAPAYIACKGALESLSYDLAALYGPSDVRVVTLSPGAIDAGLSQQPSACSPATGERLRCYGESMAVLGRLGAPDEVAAAVAWIASPDASYLTGTTITLDGGWSRHHLPTQLARDIDEAKP